MTQNILSDEQMKSINGAAKLTNDFIAKIKLTADQVQLVCRATSSIQVCDPQGKVLGTADPALFPEFIAELKRRAAAPGPFFTSAQVRSRLLALQAEWDRIGGFDENYLHEFLAKLDAADPGHFRNQGNGQ
jgi:uncharacterized protein YmfQ (DUF2313 family)